MKRTLLGISPWHLPIVGTMLELTHERSSVRPEKGASKQGAMVERSLPCLHQIVGALERLRSTRHGACGRSVLSLHETDICCQSHRLTSHLSTVALTKPSQLLDSPHIDGLP